MNPDSGFVDVYCGGSNVSIYNNTSTQQVWGIVVGQQSSSCALTTVNVYGNDISDWTEWFETHLTTSIWTAFFYSEATQGQAQLRGGTSITIISMAT